MPSLVCLIVIVINNSVWLSHRVLTYRLHLTHYYVTRLLMACMVQSNLLRMNLSYAYQGLSLSLLLNSVIFSMSVKGLPE